jgi:hypothetical protein
MPGDHDPGAAILLEAPHWTKPCLQPTVIAFDPVVGASVGAMQAAGSSSPSTTGLGGCLVGDDLHRGGLRRTERLLEEPAGSGRDTKAAHRLFERAIGTTKIAPTKVITNQAPGYPAVLGDLLPAAWHVPTAMPTIGSSVTMGG